MKVTLTYDDLTFASSVGCRRQIVNLAKGQKDGHRFGDNDPWAAHIAGAMAEMAFAKATRQWWQPTANDYKSLPGDVGLDQVRSTTRKNGGLILHPDDPDLARFWLVVSDLPDFYVVGSIRGADGKRQEFWREDVRSPAFFVPQGQLTPFEPSTEQVAA